ncbi:two component, sigma54 specific, transcriptional regulator, Fis family [Rhodopirellula maiorica SM1]|uniref:DNA-binding transcriptional regulator NtrC n=1 Tax=Rhodopirellula maiorica SM1 TaxID=1265738 RepID=M5RS05_9BACT|nr:sigma-54-dependent Fis family transcriptional regulator [Rhodopirellula maiorica]EMI22128.1 two component, sigma54 specific, transcriptional regulator, Fis family [Rhodopirellula maiorica SM1]
MSRILVVDDEPADLNLVRRALEKQDYDVATAECARDALRKLRRETVDVAVLDVMLPDEDGLDVLQKIREIDEHLPVVFVTSGGESSTAIRAMKLGALDYLLKPINVTELRSVVGRAVEIRRLTKAPVEMNVDWRSSDVHSIIGRCPAMQEVYKSIGIVAAQDVTVLIRGESGTGKELVARALYQYSERVQGPFLAVNCAAIPEALLESELFGHEKGAFTGADRKRIGKFEQCRGGTLFLDEIGDMSAVLQSKLLRVLQEKQFERVGGNETIQADVRVIAATHRNLEQMVSDGEFRADLYYRLNGFSIHLPPLRERGNDLDLLVKHFRRHASREFDKDVHEVSCDAMRILRSYSWPGNIRELQNAIRQAILKTSGPALLPDFLPAFVFSRSNRAPEEQQTNGDPPLEVESIDERKSTSAIDNQADNEPINIFNGITDRQLDFNSPHLYDDVIGAVEQQLVREVLKRTAGDKVEAARRLGINPALLRSQAALELLDLAALHHQNEDKPLIRVGMTLAEIETEAIHRALQQSGGCRKAAAKQLGISTRTMQRRVKELGI